MSDFKQPNNFRPPAHIQPQATLPRAHITEALDALLPLPGATSFARRLTLVSGPPGFGKTTAVARWLHALETRQTTPRPAIAWLPLETRHDDLQSFAVVLAQAVQSAAPQLDLAPALAGAPPPQALANGFLARLAQLDQPLILALDDYHVIHDAGVHAFVAQMVELAPSAVHLVIITRSDPPLQLSRLRVRGDMLELRAHDLRFTRAEATAYLRDIMGLPLAPHEVDILEQRTEGWIAGLQLAAYSLRRQEDPTGFLRAFAGDDRYIADYLMEEVLNRQPPGRLTFLLQTSILNRFCAELCDAVTQSDNSRAVLQSLEEDNLFLIPLDNHRQWYRYHQLFADLLRMRLQLHEPDTRELHRRAAVWYRAHDMPEEAIDHFLAAAEFEQAMDVMLLCAQELFYTSRLPRLTRWAQRLPAETLAKRPALLLALGWAWLATGHPAEAERCVRAVEDALGRATWSLCDPSDDAPDEIRPALIEAATMRSRVDVDHLRIDEALEACRCALRAAAELPSDSSSPPAGSPAGPPPPSSTAFNTIRQLQPVLWFNIGLAEKFRNNVSEAARAMAGAADEAYANHNVHLVALANGHLAHIQRIQGKFRLALQTCERGLAQLQRLTPTPTPLSGLILAQQGCILYDRNDLAPAEPLLLHAVELSEPWGNWETLLPAYLGLARLRRSRGDLDGALDALDALTAAAPGHQEVVSPLVAAYRAWFLAEAGDSATASRWLAELENGRGAILPYLRDQENLCRGWVLASLGSFAAAEAYLRRDVDEASAAGRDGRRLPLLILLAVALDAQRKPDAVTTMGRALAAAALEGIVRPFVEAGAGAESVLQRVVNAGQGGEFGRRVLAAFDRRTSGSRMIDLGPDGGILEPLTERELEVMRLIAAGYSNKEIGERLFVTEGTVKNHAHSIFGKLDVTGRTRAVARARVLGLLADD